MRSTGPGLQATGRPEGPLVATDWVTVLVLGLPKRLIHTPSIEWSLPN